MKKQIKWVALFSVVTVIILGITAFGLGTEDESTQNSTSTKQTEVVKKETTSPKQPGETEIASKGEDKKENVVEKEDVKNDEKPEQPATIEQKPETKVKNDAPTSSTPNKTVITPSTEKANVDAVSSYSTASVNRNGSTVEMHVIAEGSVDKLAQFVLPYAQMVKDLNSGVTNVQIKLYPSQQAFNQKRPSAEYKNGVLTSL